MRPEAIVALVGMIAIAGTSSSRAPETTVVQDPEAYRVYEAVFQREPPVTGAKATRVVVRAETVRNDRCGVSGPALREEWKSVIESFDRQNARPRVLLPGFALQPPYVLVTSAELDALAAGARRDEAWWGAFYQAFPDSGGFFEVSAVGFDERQTRAMAYVAHHCGGLCGSGKHHLLEKVGGRWRAARPEGLSQCQWIAGLGAAPPFRVRSPV